jgi:TRAP transporter TAXI family solute receptor
MAKGCFGAILALLLLTSSPALAEPLALGTSTTRSSTYGMGLALAKAAAEKAGLDIRVTPHGSTTQAVPLVQSGEVMLALTNAVEASSAYNGTGEFAGAPKDKLRLLATLFPLKMALGVRSDDPAQSVADLKGRPLPAGFSAALTGQALVNGLLAAGGLEPGDIEPVEVLSFSNMADEFVAGRIAAYIFVIGSSRDAELYRRVGGLRALPLLEGAEAQARLKAQLPVARIETVQPHDDIPGVEQPTPVLVYDYFLYANADLPEETVRALLAAIIESRDELIASVPAFRWFSVEGIAKQVDVPYHPAAEAYYREQGLWPN